MAREKVSRPGAVFLSYHRDAADVARWVRHVLEPLLQERLPHHGVDARALFRDERSLQPGEHWPSGLENALRNADVLVPILTPQYFERPWCLAEFWTMHDRHQRLGVPCLEPLRFSDGDFFPNEVRAIGWTDLDPGERDVGKKRFVFVRSHRKAPLALHQLIDGLCARIASKVTNTPPADPSWRFVTPRTDDLGLLHKPAYPTDTAGGAS